MWALFSNTRVVQPCCYRYSIKLNSWIRFFSMSTHKHKWNVRTQTAGDVGSTMPSVALCERSEISSRSLPAEKCRRKKPLTTYDIPHIVKAVLDAFSRPANPQDSSSSSGDGSANLLDFLPQKPLTILELETPWVL